ncbi:MAG: hypothetical protein ABFD15_06025 [Methanofastidiosum sp.]
MDNNDIYNLAKIDLVQAIKNFRSTMHHLNYNDADVEYEINDATLEASDGAIQLWKNEI